MTKFSLLYFCVGAAWVFAVGEGLGLVPAIWYGNEPDSTVVFGAVGGVMVAITVTAFVGWFAWKYPNLSLVLPTTRLTTFAQTLLSWLLYVCVGVAWVAASVVWVAAGLAIWDGNKAASTAVFVALGAVMVATFTTAVGWFAWKQRN